MTVNELILALMALPPDDEVWAMDSDGDCYRALPPLKADKLPNPHNKDRYMTTIIPINTTS